MSGARRPADLVAPCGTPAAYRRHLRRGEPVDEACRRAWNAATAASGARILTVDPRPVRNGLPEFRPYVYGGGAETGNSGATARPYVWRRGDRRREADLAARVAAIRARFPHPDMDAEPEPVTAGAGPAENDDCRCQDCGHRYGSPGHGAECGGLA